MKSVSLLPALRRFSTAAAAAERKTKKIMHAQRPGDGSLRTVSMFPGHGYGWPCV